MSESKRREKLAAAGLLNPEEEAKRKQNWANAKVLQSQWRHADKFIRGVFDPKTGEIK